MAYASLISLMTTIKSLLMTSNSPMQSLICDHREELWAIHEKVSSLAVFLNNFEKNNVSGEMTFLEVQVKEIASAVEYTIQLRLTEIEMANSKSQNKRTRRNFHHSLQQVAVDIDCVRKESNKDSR
uniref:Putative ovule protein n=1 Tax=Solanum chacoense TaxID=4108 RepID=A0A0V0HF08_SOLCH